MSTDYAQAVEDFLVFEGRPQKTARLLAIAKDLGATAVSIGMIHPRVGNEGWRHCGGYMIFTPPDERDDHGWPAAWAIARKMDISYGAGNTGQHQADTSGLLRGVWELNDDDWKRLA